jgi:hypothetical protein
MVIEYNVQIDNFNSQESIIINTKNWYNKDNEYKFEIIDPDINKIIKKIIKKNPENFRTLFPNKTVRTCCMLLNMEDQFTSIKRNNDYCYNYYEGSKSLKSKYSKMIQTKYFFYNKKLQDKINDELKIELKKRGIKNKKRIGLGEIELYNNPKIFIRQSAKEIIAAYDDSKSAANNSLYAVSFRKSSRESIFNLKLILAQLNSTLITFYAQYKRVIRYAIGKQPQIKISDLNSIPIFINSIYDKELVSHVDKILINSNSQTSINKIDINKIDEIIYNYYHISKTEIKFIIKSVAEFKIS